MGKRDRRRVLLAAGLAVVLAGCGSSGGGTVASPSSTGESTEVPTGLSSGDPSATTGLGASSSTTGATGATGSTGSTGTNAAGGVDGADVAFSCLVGAKDDQKLGMCTLDRSSGQVVVVGSTLGPSVAPAWNPARGTYPLAYVCRYQRRSAQELWPAGEGADLGSSGFARNQGGEICVVDREGRAKQVTETGQRANAPVWSPDGTRLAFAMGSGPVVAAAGSTTTTPKLGPGLYVLTVDATTRLTNGTSDDFPDWSPDGTRLAFTSERGIATAAADGSGRRQLTSGSWVDLGPQWSPDGAWIAFMRYPHGAPTRREVWVMRADGSAARLLVRLGGGFDPDVIYDSTPAWSPDGTRLAVGGAYGDGATALSVLVVTVTSGAVTVVSPPAAADTIGSFLPSWSPDGTELLFLQDHAEGATRLMQVRADGSDLRPVTAVTMAVFDPSWG